ncbi:MAG: PIN/TRAM domain-containing protein [Bacillota bacterium]
MVKRIVFFLLVIAFASLGFYAGLRLVNQNVIPISATIPQLSFGIIGLATLIGLVAGVLLAPWIMRGIIWAAVRMEQYLQKTPGLDLVMGSVGLIIGLIIANLLGSLLAFLGPPGKFVWALATILFGYLGLTIGLKKREEIFSIFSNFPRFGSKDKAAKSEAKQGNYKILDTSVIIDGRISDLCGSGFIEGVLLVPAFVLEELRHIADSPDLLKRNRGRRGLDILNNMRKDSSINVQIYDNVNGLEESAEVDTKLVRLAQLLGSTAKIVTNDYNLNKVAELHGVKVLNINELANAVKPVVLPGEEMVVQVVKDGKEVGQGVAYLDDGTMIVVDGGKRYLGQTITVLVTSVLQTAAGRMIFARPKPVDRRSEPGSSRYSEVNALG